jgi:hypothetical protein
MRRLTKIDLLKCLLGFHSYERIYPEAEKSPLRCVNCGKKKRVVSFDKFSEERYEFYRLIATIGDGIK